MGENGAGKSTLIKIVTGVQPADSGRLLARRRRSVSFGEPARGAWRAGIGVVHQERNVVREFSVGENIALSGMPRRLGPRRLARRLARGASAASRCSTSTSTRGRPMRDLSAAQTQLVEIARGLYREAKVLLLDEPTASLSVDEAERLYKVVRQLQLGGHARSCS